MNTLNYLTLFSGFSFLFFGSACFLTKKMKTEFERYGLTTYRRLVGALQIIGGLGLIVGSMYYPVLQLVAAAGLAILMLLGFLVRLKIKDTFILAAPSLGYALLNAYIFYKLLSYYKFL